MQLHVAIAAIQKAIYSLLELENALAQWNGVLLPQAIAYLAMRNEACRPEQHLVGIERVVEVREVQYVRFGIQIRRPHQIETPAEVSTEARFDEDLRAFAGYVRAGDANLVVPDCKFHASIINIERPIQPGLHKNLVHFNRDLHLEAFVARGSVCERKPL